MRHAATLPFFLAPLVLGACAGTRGGSSVESTVVLGPGGRAEGRLVVPAGTETEIELENEGPGRADYEIRTEDGEKLASGALHEASAGFRSTEPTTLVVVIETYKDAGTTVEYEIESRGSLDLTWDLSRALAPQGAAK